VAALCELAVFGLVHTGLVSEMATLGRIAISIQGASFLRCLQLQVSAQISPALILVGCQRPPAAMRQAPVCQLRSTCARRASETRIRHTSVIPVELPAFVLTVTLIA
jgi:hypothetical protein